MNESKNGLKGEKWEEHGTLREELQGQVQEDSSLKKVSKDKNQNKIIGTTQTLTNFHKKELSFTSRCHSLFYKDSFKRRRE